ncbi:MAG: hypothetical protein M3444_03445 [Acidobacteriota bacterium]|nr:hypothetical protein [Acidobacteriota bacterium]MDQ5835461.1 hypothetical protein [Acidobacteriota bacterium]
MRLRTPNASRAHAPLVMKSVGFLLALFVASSAAAQLPKLEQDSKLPQLSQESKDEKEKAQKELEKKALQLLDDTLQSAQALKLAENRAVIRAQAADLLWKRDEKRARALFRDAIADLVAARGEAAKNERATWMLAELRPRLLYMIAARDPQLALDLLRESRPASNDDSAQGSWASSQEQNLEQAIAAQAAENDPKLALKMAEEGLEKGVNFGVLNVLERLRQKDPESAKKLAGELVEKLQGETLSRGQEASLVAVSLLRSVLMPHSPQQYFFGPLPPSGPAEKPKPLVLEDGDLRALAELVTGAALKDSNASGAYGLTMQLRPLLPDLEKLVPARVAQLRQRMAEMDKALDPLAKSWMQFNSVVGGDASADAILEAAAKAPPEMRQSYYSLAAMKLVQTGDTERARQVINDDLTGQEREQMLAQLDGAAISRAVEKGNLEDARAVISRIKSKERRAGALSELALAFAAKGDKKGAAQLLEEARALVSRQPDNEREVGALLEVARGYALVEPSKTFEMIDPLIDQANDMLAAAALLEKFGAGQGFFRKGEMILSPGMANLGGMYARYVKALAELARVDFDRTKTDAERFHHEEVRLMARLVISQSVLSDHLDAGGTSGSGEGYAYGYVGGAILVSH